MSGFLIDPDFLIPKEMFIFFSDLQMNNNRIWFTENKQRYEQDVKLPMYQLSSLLSPTAEFIYPGIDTRPQRVVSRVYLDARRHHAVPYRDHVWLCYKPIGKRTGECFSIYVYFELNEWGIGCGFYSPQKEYMDDVRVKLLHEHNEYNKIAFQLKKNGYVFFGNAYKRSICPEVLQGSESGLLYNQKNISVVKSFPITRFLFEPGIGQFISDELLTQAEE